MGTSHGKYVYATGEAGANRLRLLDSIFGPGTRALLARLGVGAGLCVAEIGCGAGQTTVWMAGQVGAEGHVAAVDSSADQLRLTRKNAAEAKRKNISFHEGSAEETGLPRESFDLVYSRFLLCHLTNPVAALKEMKAVLKKGGLLVCEDYDAGSIATEPPTRAYQKLVELIRAVDGKRGVDSFIGVKLHRLFGKAGFASPEVSVEQIVRLRGEGKEFWEQTVREAAPLMLELGVATAEELESLGDEMRAIAQDETTLLVVARVWQVWAERR